VLTDAARATVIVPAHNESAVIERCLATLLAGALPGEFQVVVVSNGSHDATAALARSFTSHPVEVVELPAPSKIAALRAGLARARAGVRVVVDADVLLSTSALRELVSALAAAEPNPRAGSPQLAVDTFASSPLVRAYYRTWTRLPYVRTGMIGSGVFAVNLAGASRLSTLPDILNDDEWVRRSFPPPERITTLATFTMTAPRTLRALISRNARAHLGNRELNSKNPGNGNTIDDLIKAVRSREVTPTDALTYLAVVALSRTLARWRLATGRTHQWSTDHTSRARPQSVR
jgi:glycosyltransferase involved in cell wall biosynthesis